MKSEEFPIFALTDEAFLGLSARGIPETQTTAGSAWDAYCKGLADERLAMQNRNGVIVQPVNGVLCRGADVEMEAFYGFMDSGRIDLACEAAAATGRGLVLAFDSPGGVVAGWEATLSAIAEARKARPEMTVAAYVGGMCCSLAYIFAAQCEVIACAPGSVIGSIGVMAVTRDTSEMYRQNGIECRLFADGTYKGMGTPGVPWKSEWYAAVQAGIDETSKAIRSHISANRKGVKVEDMQGQVWGVEKAPKALYDDMAPGTLDDFLDGV